jgi:hypothetical protein
MLSILRAKRLVQIPFKKPNIIEAGEEKRMIVNNIETQLICV